MEKKSNNAKFTLKFYLGLAETIKPPVQWIINQSKFHNMSNQLVIIVY